METISVPTVTEDDLRAFRSKHFPSASAPIQFFTSTSYINDEDNGLGYYPDGTKRYLTDEQIAIFRHSELFKIIRDREIAEISGEHEAQNEQCDEGADRQYAANTNRCQYSRGAIALKDFVDEPETASQSTTNPTGTTKTRTRAQKLRRPAKKRKRAMRQKQLRDAAANGEGNASGDDDDGSGDEVATTSGTKESATPQDDTSQAEVNVPAAGGWREFVEDEDGNGNGRTHRRLARELDEQEYEATELVYD
ncbi:hypothetical protein BDZ85DRAFT_99216 [Elsinoe ampelina]|uniref:Uncharacterized protein n=1 Tax=Elsinoe ampelina TaxID=302913 RepID=A0A6A6GEX3_9PEZI|nr:hypothetical protein BDZ85DRAFT_99216 [Elsinoe ampelina]